MKKHILAENYERFFGKLNEGTKDLSSLPDNEFYLDFGSDYMSSYKLEELLDKLFELGYKEGTHFILADDSDMITVNSTKMMNDAKVMELLDSYKGSGDFSGASDSDFR